MILCASELIILLNVSMTWSKRCPETWGILQLTCLTRFRYLWMCVITLSTWTAVVALLEKPRRNRRNCWPWHFCNLVWENCHVNVQKLLLLCRIVLKVMLFLWSGIRTLHSCALYWHWFSRQSLLNTTVGERAGKNWTERLFMAATLKQHQSGSRWRLCENVQRYSESV